MLLARIVAVVTVLAVVAVLGIAIAAWVFATPVDPYMGTAPYMEVIK